MRRSQAEKRQKYIQYVRHLKIAESTDNVKLFRLIEKKEWNEVARHLDAKKHITCEVACELAKRLLKAGRLDLMYPLLQSRRISIIDIFATTFLETKGVLNPEASSLRIAFLTDPTILSLIRSRDLSDAIYDLIRAGHTFEASFFRIKEMKDVLATPYMMDDAIHHKNASFLTHLLQENCIVLDQNTYEHVVRQVIEWGRVDVLQIVLQYPLATQYDLGRHFIYMLAIQTQPDLAMLSILINDTRFQFEDWMMHSFVMNGINPGALSLLLDRYDLSEEDARRAIYCPTRYDSRMVVDESRRVEIYELLLVKSRQFKRYIGNNHLIEQIVKEGEERMQELTLLMKHGYVPAEQMNKVIQAAIRHKQHELLTYAIHAAMSDQALAIAVRIAIHFQNEDAIYTLLKTRPKIIRLLPDERLLKLPMSVIFSLLSCKPIRKSMIRVLPENHAILHHDHMVDHFDHYFTEVPPGMNRWLPDGGPRFREDFEEMFPDSGPPSSYL